MSEYKSRINIQVKNVSDWEKLFDIKMKERMGTWRRCKKFSKCRIQKNKQNL